MTDSEPIFVNVPLWDNSTTTLRLFKPGNRKDKADSPLVMV